MENEELKNVAHPICPINLYFEGDEGKCDVTKCEWDINTRSCTQQCSVDKIICPVCKKDLTEALKVLNADFSFHMDVHFKEWGNEIFTYLREHRDELPEELKKILKEREDKAAALVIYNKAIKEDN
jgi:hypothetical protein